MNNGKDAAQATSLLSDTAGDARASFSSRAVPLVQARGIMKEYGGEPVLAGCDLVLSAGESVALVGASGEGKSTLLSVLGLLLSPSAGRLEVGGCDTAGLGDFELSRLRAATFGFVFQHTQLIGSLRAIDNVLVPSCFGQAGGPAVATRGAHLITRLGLARRAQYFPYQLSVGQKRRVALARALLLEPAVLMADEPTNDLDPSAAAMVIDTIMSYPDAKHAVLFVTHDVALACRADRILRLNDGVLLSVDASELAHDGGITAC